MGCATESAAGCRLRRRVAVRSIAWLDVLVATPLIAMLMDKSFPSAFTTRAAVKNIRVWPLRECFLKNTKCELRITLFDNAANLKAEEVVQ